MYVNKIVISGASGFVGKNVGQFLAKNDFEIIGLLRKGKEKTVNFGQAVISEDLTENDLVHLLRDSVAFLHFIGIGKQTVATDYEKVNVGLTRNAIRLCKKTNIKKIIFISGLGDNAKSTSA